MLVAVGCLALFAGSIAWWAANMLLQESVAYRCGAAVSSSNLASAGMLSGLTPLAGCNEETAGLRGGKTRSSIARGERLEVEAALRSGGVPVDQILNGPKRLRRAGPMYLPSGYSPYSRARVPWNIKHGYHYDDVVRIEGREWDRSMTWGPASDHDGWLLMVVLETGSL